MPGSPVSFLAVIVRVVVDIAADFARQRLGKIVLNAVVAALQRDVADDVRDGDGAVGDAVDACRPRRRR